MFHKIVERKIVTSRHYLIYIVAGLVLFAAVIVNLSLHTWFSYCLWNYGLVYGSSHHDYSYHFSDESSLADIKSDACGSIRDDIQRECPRFCDYINYFMSAGGIMLFCGIASLIFLLFSVFFHYWKKDKPSFHMKGIWVFVCFPSAFYIIGLVLYCIVGDFANLETTDKGKDDVKDFEMKGGLIMAIVLCVMHLALMTYSLLTTIKSFFN